MRKESNEQWTIDEFDLGRKTEKNQLGFVNMKKGRLALEREGIKYFPIFQLKFFRRFL